MDTARAAKTVHAAGQFRRSRRRHQDRYAGVAHVGRGQSGFRSGTRPPFDAGADRSRALLAARWMGSRPIMLSDSREAVEMNAHGGRAGNGQHTLTGTD